MLLPPHCFPCTSIPVDNLHKINKKWLIFPFLPQGEEIYTPSLPTSTFPCCLKSADLQLFLKFQSSFATAALLVHSSKYYFQYHRSLAIPGRYYSEFQFSHLVVNVHSLLPSINILKCSILLETPKNVLFKCSYPHKSFLLTSESKTLHSLSFI